MHVSSHSYECLPLHTSLYFKKANAVLHGIVSMPLDGQMPLYMRIKPIKSIRLAASHVSQCLMHTRHLWASNALFQPSGLHLNPTAYLFSQALFTHLSPYSLGWSTYLLGTFSEQK